MASDDLALRRRRSRQVAATGLFALIVLIVVTVVLRFPAIETDIENRSMLRVMVSSRALGVTGAEADGRDVTLFGEVPPEEAAHVVDVVGNLWGVGAVTLAEAPLASGPDGETSTTTVPPATTTATGATTTTPPTTSTTPPTTSTTALEPAALTLEGGVVTATVSSPIEARRLEMAAAAAGLTAAVTVDGAVAPARWSEDIGDALESLRGVADARVTIDAAGVTVAGEVASIERQEQVRQAFLDVGLDLDDSGLVVAEAPDEGTAQRLEEELNTALSEALVLFETGSTAISGEGSVALDRIAELLGDVPGARVEVQGHTDDEGDEEGNLALSQDRADAVAEYLVDAGVDPVQVTAVGYGESQPVADNTTEEGRAANRRIEFSVEGAG